MKNNHKRTGLFEMFEIKAYFNGWNGLNNLSNRKRIANG
jgi:hypothetical protein